MGCSRWDFGVLWSFENTVENWRMHERLFIWEVSLEIKSGFILFYFGTADQRWWGRSWVAASKSSEGFCLGCKSWLASESLRDEEKHPSVFVVFYLLSHSKVYPALIMFLIVLRMLCEKSVWGIFLGFIISFLFNSAVTILCFGCKNCYFCCGGEKHVFCDCFWFVFCTLKLVDAANLQAEGNLHPNCS